MRAQAPKMPVSTGDGAASGDPRRLIDQPTPARRSPALPQRKRSRMGPLCMEGQHSLLVVPYR